MKQTLGQNQEGIVWVKVLMMESIFDEIVGLIKVIFPWYFVFFFLIENNELLTSSVIWFLEWVLQLFIFVQFSNWELQNDRSVIGEQSKSFRSRLVTYPAPKSPQKLPKTYSIETYVEHKGHEVKFLYFFLPFLWRHNFIIITDSQTDINWEVAANHWRKNGRWFFD